jgi:hypothetical protein
MAFHSVRSQREKFGTGHGEGFLMAAEWGPVEIHCSDDNGIGVVWVIVLERNFELLGVGGAGSGVLGIVGVGIVRCGGRRVGAGVGGPHCMWLRWLWWLTVQW